MDEEEEEEEEGKEEEIYSHDPSNGSSLKIVMPFCIVRAKKKNVIFFPRSAKSGIQMKNAWNAFYK